MSKEMIVYKFIMGNEGDSSVGIDAYHEEVTLSFRYGTEFEPEDVDFIKEMFAKLIDGFCVTKEEWDKKTNRE